MRTARPLFEKTAALFSGFIFFCLCLFFCCALVAAFSPLKDGGGLYIDFSILRTALFTFKQAALSTFLAMILGIATAFFCARRNFPGKRFLLSLSSVPLCVPPLLLALGFVMFYGMRGTVNSFLMRVFSLDAPPVVFLYSFYGVVLAQGFYNFPIVMRTCTDAWCTLTTEQYDAAVMLGAGKIRVFRTITLVQLLPAIASSGIVVFIYCFFSFVIVLLFGGIGITVLEVEIFQSIRSSLDFSRAASFALVEILITMIVVACYAILEKKSASSRGIGFGNDVRPCKNISPAEMIPAFLFFGAVLLFLLGPMLCIFTNAFSESASGYLSHRIEGFPFSLKNFSSLFSRRSFWHSLVNTLFTAASSSFLSVTGAFFFASLTRSLDPRKKSVFIRTVPLLPMAVSSIVIGFGFIKLFPVANPLILVIAQSSLSWPFALKQISAGMDRIPLEVTDAASMLAPSRLIPVFNIYVPMTWRNIISAFGFCFAVSCGDTNLPLVFALPDFETLSLYTYKLAGSYHFREACACGVILALVTIPVFVLSAVSGQKSDGRNRILFPFRKEK